MKKNYEKIVLDILVLGEVDVLTGSNGFTPGENELPWQDI